MSKTTVTDVPAKHSQNQIAKTKNGDQESQKTKSTQNETANFLSWRPLSGALTQAAGRDFVSAADSAKTTSSQAFNNVRSPERYPCPIKAFDMRTIPVSR